MPKWISIKNGRPDLLQYVRDGDDEWLRPTIVAEIVTRLWPVSSSAFRPGPGADEDGFISRGTLPGERQEWVVCEGPSVPQSLKDWEHVEIVFASKVVHYGREVTHEGQRIALAQIIREAQAVVNKTEDPIFDTSDVFYDFTDLI